MYKLTKGGCVLFTNAALSKRHRLQSFILYSPTTLTKYALMDNSTKLTTYEAICQLNSFLHSLSECAMLDQTKTKATKKLNSLRMNLNTTHLIEAGARTGI